MTTVVLVHGFGHASWCWSLVTERFAARGLPSVAVDLDGQGLKSTMPPGSVTASSAAATLVDQIRRIGRGEPCVVVAHSMGGTVATAAAEIEPSLFAELIYVAAYAPVAGLPTMAYFAEPESAGEMVTRLLVGDPAQTGMLRIGLDDRTAIRETFYGDVEPVIADAAIALLSSGAPVGIPVETLTVTPQRYGSVPKAYVLCERDTTVVPVALQRRMIREIDAVSAASTVVIDMDAAHSPFLSRPDDFVNAIVEHRALISARRSLTTPSTRSAGST